MAHAPNRSVRVTRRDGPTLGTAAVDGPMLTQAISNLIANGIRFTPDGGRVEITAEPTGGELVGSSRRTVERSAWRARWAGARRS